MVVEFQKRIARHDREIADLARAGQTDTKAYWILQGARGEAETLLGFYQSQMVATGRVKPEGEDDGKDRNGPS